MKASVTACMATVGMVVVAAAAAAMVVVDLVATPMLTVNGRQSRSKLSQKVF